MSSFNNQPIFASTPFYTASVFDPVIPTNNYSYGDLNSDGITVVFDGATIFPSEGGVIKRVTVVAAADTSNIHVTEKLVYLYVGNNYRFFLHKTAHMPDTTVSNTIPPPSIEWTFGDGLQINTNDFRLAIASSVNYNTYSRYGDYLSVTVEGATYTSV
mgnify:CR=1 FL=1